MAASHQQSSYELADHFDPVQFEGSEISVSGCGVHVAGPLGVLQMHARVEIETGGEPLLAEVSGVGERAALALPFGSLSGVKRGARVWPSDARLGRIGDGLGRPIDGEGPLARGVKARKRCRLPKLSHNRVSY